MKDIKGYEGQYAITEEGQVWSYKRKIFLKPCLTRGYLWVGLCKNGITKKFKIHRLVAEAFIPNPENKPEVNHKDENKQNNCVSNLEWMTTKENINYGTRNKRVAVKNSKPVLCVELNKIFESQTVAAQELNLHRESINACCNGKAKTTGGYHFTFATGI